MLAAALRMLRAGATEGGVRIDGDRVIHDDGTVASIIATGDLDITGLDPEGAAAVTSAVGRLLAGLRSPLQMVVQSRRWRDHVPPTQPHAVAVAGQAGLVARLLAAELTHREALVQRRDVMRRRVLLIPTAPDADLQRLRSSVEVIGAALDAAAIDHRVVDGDELVTTIMEAWGEGATGPPQGGTDGMLTLHPPSWEAGSDQARIGSVQVRAVRLQRLPGIAVRPGWLAPLLRTGVECDVAIELVPIEVADAMRRLQRHLRGLRADQLVELDRETLGNATVDAGVDGALDLRDRLSHNAGRPLLLWMVAVARGTDARHLAPAADALRTALVSTMAQAQVTDLEHLQAARSSWPLGSRRRDGGKLVDSVAAASCMPWVESVCDDPDGYALGRALQTSTPVRIDPFDRRLHPNGNIAVIAASGRGKSYALGAVVLAAAARGIGSIILDPEAEYARLVAALGGDYLTLVPGCDTSLNIFDVAGSDEESHGEVAGAVVALCVVLCGGLLDDVERAQVDAAAHAALRHAASSGRTAVLGDCLAGLSSSAPRVATVLQRFCTGPLGALFNRPTSVRLDARVVGISLRDLRDELVPAATLIVAEWLWALVRRNPEPRHIVVDEVGLLCAHPPLRTLLAQLARRCRKYSASLVVATQNAGDLLATEEGRVMATNAAIVLLGGQRGADTGLMQSAFSLTDAQRVFLEGAGRGEFLLLAGRRRMPMMVDLPAEQHALITAR